MVAIAHAMASREKSQVLYSHIQKAVDHTVAFMDDFNRVVRSERYITKGYGSAYFVIM